MNREGFSEIEMELFKLRKSVPTIRQHYAAMAMQAIIMGHQTAINPDRRFATVEDAFKMADEMIAYESKPVL